MLVYPFLASAAVRQKYSGYLNTGKWQSNTRPIRHPTSFYHLNTKQVRYPDPHCMFFATTNHTIDYNYSCGSFSLYRFPCLYFTLSAVWAQYI